MDRGVAVLYQQSPKRPPKRGQTPKTKWPEGCFAFLGSDPFSFSPLVGQAIDMHKTVRDFAWLYLFGLLGLWILFHTVSTGWWPVTVMLFAPRWVYGLPLFVLVPLTLISRFRLIPFYLVHVAILVVPLMGWQIPGGWQIPDRDRSTAFDGQWRLRVISCNLGGGEPDLVGLVRVVESSDCELLLLQECPSGVSQQIASALRWNLRTAANLATLSPYPMSPAVVLARQDPTAYQAVAAVGCELDLSAAALPLLSEMRSRQDNVRSGGSEEDAARESVAGEKLQVVNVHLPTLRPGLERLLEVGIDGVVSVERATEYHERLSRRVAESLRGNRLPKLIAGDFNMPIEGQSIRRHWGHLHNAFSISGTGFGYTKKTRWHGIRIDHVLTDDAWRPLAAHIGPDLGGDHRPLFVELGRVR